MGALSFMDLGVALGMNLALSVIFLFLYSLFSVQPVNARVYFTKWFVLDDEAASREREEGGSCVFQFSWRIYLRSLDFIFVAMRKPERELLEHAGLDMVVFLRMLKLGFKMFLPIMVVAFIVLFPTYFTADFLPTTELSQTSVDYLTMSNIEPRSNLFWVPWVCAWCFHLWALLLMHNEYRSVAQMRLDYLEDQQKSAQQFTVLVRQVPKDNTRTVAQQTAQFFSVVHRDHYLMTTPVYDARKLSKLEVEKEWTENKVTALEVVMESRPGWRPRHKTGFMGLCGASVDSLDFHQSRLAEINKQIGEERARIVSDEKCIMAANFVSFRTRWGAAVAGQTQQGKDSTKWITTWAPEPRDVCWTNLALPYLSLTTRKFAVGLVLIGTIIFYTVPITFVQGLASLNSLAKVFPFLQPVLDLPFINSFMTSFLPGLALMVFLSVLPMFLRILSGLEGYVAHSQIELAAAGKFFYFMFFSVFLTNALVGSAWGQIIYFIHNPAQLPTALGSAITGSSNFFMTFTMLHAWTSVSTELIRVVPLIVFHIKNALLVRTLQERKKAMQVSGPDYATLIPFVELYFLLPFVFMVIAPLYLPFVIVFFAFGYIVYRSLFINVHSAAYDLGGGHWPHFHRRILICMVFSQVLLIVVFALHQVILLTVLLLPLPLVTILIDLNFISAAFAPTFQKYALEEAMRKDTIDVVSNPNDNPRVFLARKYLHPSLISAYELMDEESGMSNNEMLNLVSFVTDDRTTLDAAAGAPLVEVRRHPRSRGTSPSPFSARPVTQARVTFQGGNVNQDEDCQQEV